MRVSVYTHLLHEFPMLQLPHVYVGYRQNVLQPIRINWVGMYVLSGGIPDARTTYHKTCILDNDPFNLFNFVYHMCIIGFHSLTTVLPHVTFWIPYYFNRTY